MKMINCPKFLNTSPFCLRTCITALASGFDCGDGGEFVSLGKAFIEVSEFMVTINCSLKAS